VLIVAYIIYTIAGSSEVGSEIYVFYKKIYPPL